MSVIYSGQTILNTTIDGSTQTNFNQALVNALISAGWSLVQSGSSNGIWRVRSAATPQGLQGDLWLYNGTATSGTAPAILEAASMLSTTNVGTSSYQNQSPVSIACGAGFTYQLIATGFYFYLVRTTIPCPAQSSYFWCVPYLPSNLTGLISSFLIAYGSTGGNDTLGSTGLFGSASGLPGNERLVQLFERSGPHRVQRVEPLGNRAVRERHWRLHAGCRDLVRRLRRVLRAARDGLPDRIDWFADRQPARVRLHVGRARIESGAAAWHHDLV
jgi:hypothetical protein